MGGSDGSIALYTMATSELAHTFPPAAESPVASIDFSENGTWIASAHQGSTSVIVWDLRKTSQLIAHDVGTVVTSIAWDYTGQFLAACGPSGVVVKQYEKKSKKWTEPLRKAIAALDVQWSAEAKSLVALTQDGGLAVLSS